MKINLLTMCFGFGTIRFKCFATVLLSVLAIHSNAQVVVDQPINRAVYQRTGSGNGTANLIISGTYTTTEIATSAQARLVDPVTTMPIAGFNWSVVDNGPSKGVFYGVLNNVPAGWYTVQLRILKEGLPIDSGQVSRVGVGDVFLIAGQSNASGDNTSGFLGATNERVVTDNLSLPCVGPNTFPEFPAMEQLISNTKIALNGENAWAYGKLGDDLVSQTGFPVAFFNAGTGGASIQNFTQSMLGQSTIHPFTGSQFCGHVSNAVGQPYRTISTSMSYYNSLFGIRALLWHQGESDKFLGTSLSSYEARLDSLIDFVRTDFDPNYNMPWVVSRASYYLGSGNAGIISAQTNVINNDPFVFPGPSTDGIVGTGRRNDNVHFNDQGLVDLANDWKNSLNASFFSTATAKEANLQPSVGITRNGNNVTLTISEPNISTYKWISGNNFDSPALGTSSAYTASNGTFRCYLTDNNGNIRVSQAINVDAVKSQSDNNPTCTTVTQLSDLKPFSIVNGLGPIGINKSNGENGDGDGNTLKMDGLAYAKGIGVHSTSELVYLLPSGLYQSFLVDIGVDDEVDNLGTVKFQIFNDNTLLYESPLMTGNSGTIKLNQNIAGVTRLKLKVIAIDNTLNDHANWANARLVCSASPDVLAPSVPSNVVVSSQLTKCLSFSWTAATDNVGVSGYYIYLNDKHVDTVPSSQLSYSFTGLEIDSMYTFGVQAFDAFQNQSSDVVIASSTLTMLAVYPGSTNPVFGDICINTTEIPVKTPAGGIFEFVSGIGAYTLNPSTGAFSSPVDNGFFGIKYTVDKNGVCEDAITVNVRTNLKPGPTIISGPDIANVGVSTNYSAATCTAGTVRWENGSIGSAAIYTFSDTTTIFAFCRNNGCFSDTSNQILVKIIPDCPDSFNLGSPSQDLNASPPSLFFKASEQIQAVNKLTGASFTTYKAGEAIFLNPGFVADSGTVFSATIEGCP